MSRRRLDPDSLTRPLTIKISAAQHAAWSIAAARADVSLGEWIRAAADRAMRDPDYRQDAESPPTRPKLR